MEEKEKVNNDALDFWRYETKLGGIATLCKKLDEYLVYGIQIGKITEFCGAPATGKTQFCLQLCVNVQIPKDANGKEGKAIFIDTKNTLNPFRLKDIALSVSQRVQYALPSTSTKSIFDTDSILKNVFYIYCKNVTELLAAIILSKDMLKNDKNIKLLIIDSFSYIFRICDNYTKRTGLMNRILSDLNYLAIEYEIAIVITNEFTTSYDSSNNLSFCPALGESHSHKINTRLIFAKADGSNIKDHYLILIDKCIICPKVLVSFRITDSGIRNFRNS